MDNAFANWEHAYHLSEEGKCVHGRMERREHWVIEVPEPLRKKAAQWPGLQTLPSAHHHPGDLGLQHLTRTPGWGRPLGESAHQFTLLVQNLSIDDLREHEELWGSPRGRPKTKDAERVSQSPNSLGGSYPTTSHALPYAGPASCGVEPLCD